MKRSLLKFGNAISSKVVRVPESTRIVIMYICLAALDISNYIYLFDSYTMKFIYPAMLNAGIGTLIFAILILIGMDREYTEEVFDKRWIVVIFMCVCGLMITISGLLHDIGYSYIAMGLLMLFVMPIYCLVWGDQEHLTKLFIAFSRVLIFFFVIFFFLHVFIAPRCIGGFYMDGRYMGMGSNPNGIAKAAVPGYCAALYLLVIGKTKRKFLLAIAMGISLAFLIMSSSRASFLAVCVLTFFCVFMKVKNKVHEGQLKKCVINIGIVVLIICATIPAAKYALDWNDNNMKQIELQRVQENQAQQSEQEEPAVIAIEPAIDDIEITDRAGQGKNDDGTTDLDGLSSGRLSIWADVIRGAKFMGRDKDDIVFNAHNSIIEYLKRSGWIASISFFLVELGSAIWILATVFSKRKVEDYEIFAVMGITAFGLISLVDIVDLPFAKMVATIFYICFAAICVKRKSTIS